jgi:hypothetical protein
MKDIDHLAYIEAASSFVNIEVVLHFHEVPSQQSRSSRMDANGDGRITSAELDLYCSTVDLKLLRRFILRIGSKPVPLVSLYRPEVDLLGDDRVQQAPHLLRIFLTASLPSNASEAALVRFEDRSFSAVAGRTRMEVRAGSDSSSPVLQSSANREITFRLPPMPRGLDHSGPDASIPDLKERPHEATTQ